MSRRTWVVVVLRFRATSPVVRRSGMVIPPVKNCRKVARRGILSLTAFGGETFQGTRPEMLAHLLAVPVSDHIMSDDGSQSADSLFLCLCFDVVSAHVFPQNSAFIRGFTNTFPHLGHMPT